MPNGTVPSAVAPVQLQQSRSLMKLTRRYRARFCALQRRPFWSSKTKRGDLLNLSQSVVGSFAIVTGESNAG
jgi:hypothetical protein